MASQNPAEAGFAVPGASGFTSLPALIILKFPIPSQSHGGYPARVFGHLAAGTANT